MIEIENLQTEINQIINTDQTNQPVVPLDNIQASTPVKTINQNQNNKKKTDKLTLILVLGIIIGILILIILLQKIFEKNSYAGCIKDENNRVVILEPAYCATPDGKIFWKNKKDAIQIEEDGSIDTLDSNNPPETILPELL